MLGYTSPRWAPASADPEPEVADGDMPDWDRRRFLRASGGVAAGAVVMGVVGRNLLENQAGGAAPDVELPTAAGPVPEVPASASLDVEGITPIVVPNDDFYQIDTALITPRVNVNDWNLRIHGLVDREVSLTYDDLSAMPLFEQYVTIACVSNEIGGRLVGNALWTGVDLRDAKMSGARLTGSILTGANMRGADLFGADLSHCDLSEAVLADADLRGARLHGANFISANLRRADLRDGTM